MITVKTPRCVVCKQTGEIQVDEEGWALFATGAYVQDAFPSLDAAQRELLITGTHEHCWTKMMGEEE